MWACRWSSLVGPIDRRGRKSRFSGVFVLFVVTTAVWSTATEIYMFFFVAVFLFEGSGRLAHHRPFTPIAGRHRCHGQLKSAGDGSLF